MTMGLMATKIGMTQVFVEDGVCVPVTVLQIDPNVVVAHKTMDTDGYTSVQLGYGSIREKLVTKALKGHFKKANVENKRHLSEFRVDAKQLESFEIGKSIGIEYLDGVASVDVSGVSKGKGFAGVMKRHNFAGFPASHGTHETFRHGGSIGMRSQPGKVLKGKKMAGQMGNELVTTQNLRIIKIMPEQNLVLLRGAVPGSKGKIVELKISTRKPKAVLGVAGAVVEEASKNPMKASKAGKGAAKSPAGKKK